MQVFSIFKKEHTREDKDAQKENLLSHSMLLNHICLIHLVEGKITKINSYLY